MRWVCQCGCGRFTALGVGVEGSLHWVWACVCERLSGLCVVVWVWTGHCIGCGCVFVEGSLGCVW